MGINDGMENLVYKINNLQDMFCKVGESLEIERLKLPQIVVIGGQSVGKSSVLENIVGRNFIPRGNDIVTRCPLYLQLINDQKEFGEFLHLPGKIFTDFKEIQTEIEKRTVVLAGKEGISAESITLKLHSSKVLDLTLVDLPGLVEVAVKNQNENISQQIRDVATKYIKEKNALILAVSSATEDLANSVALKLASQVDPLKQRTIGIITKMDLVQDKDKLKRMIEILNNNFYPVKLGHIGVYNMSNDDLKNNKSIEQFLLEQQQFFTTKSIFNPVLDRVGTENLQKILNNELSNHIRHIAPSFRKMIQTHIRVATAELYKYGENEKKGEVNELHKLHELINALQENFDKEIGRSGNVNIDWRKVSIGAKINHMLNTQFPEKIMAVPEDNDIMRKIANLILNQPGIHLSTFIPQESFHATIIQLIDKYLPISLEVVDAISNEMEVLIDICNQELKIYPKLRDSIDVQVKTHIRNVTNLTKDKISEMIETECSYINTEHKDFSQMKEFLDNDCPQVAINDLSGEPSVSTDAKNSIEIASIVTDQTQSDEEDDDFNDYGYSSDMSSIASQMESSPSTRLLYKMSMKYIKIIETTLIDYIPKLVMNSMVRSTQKFLKIGLLVNIQKECDITTLLSRSIDEQTRIEQLREKLTTCKEALKILNNI